MMTRRIFLAAGAGLAFGAANPTADEVIRRIKEHVGIPWRAETVDKIVAGDGSTAVKGIATTMMATLDVIQRASAAGKNLVITHEPTFWLHQDTTKGLENDATLKFKRDFIAKNNMVVFRFHDHWHMMKPDGIAFGMARDLGWEKYETGPTEFVIPATPLSKLTAEIRAKLSIRAMRVVGDPNLSVKRVAASWGAGGRDGVIKLIARADVDAVIIGEGREWEVVEYAQDAIALGKKVALIILGHVPSEQSGMKYCAEWLRTFITDVPVEFVPAAEPFL